MSCPRAGNKETLAQIVCATCQTHYRADTNLAGRRFRCKRCGAVLVIVAPPPTRIVRSRHGPLPGLPGAFSLWTMRSYGPCRGPAIWPPH